MAGSRGNPVRHGLRFVAHVLILSGVLLIADAAATLAWQEPVSAFLTQREQASLKRALEDPPRRVVEKEPLEGDAIGKIELPTLDKSVYVVEGTDRDTLRKGPGHYPETPLPGERGTVGIAGHRTTNGAPFRKIDKLKRGDPVIVSMPFGRFVYRVEKTKIVKPTETSVKAEGRLQPPHPQRLPSALQRGRARRGVRQGDPPAAGGGPKERQRPAVATCGRFRRPVQALPRPPHPSRRATRRTARARPAAPGRSR